MSEWLKLTWVFLAGSVGGSAALFALIFEPELARMQERLDHATRPLIHIGNPVNPKCHVELEDPDVAARLISMNILRWVEACEKLNAKD